MGEALDSFWIQTDPLVKGGRFVTQTVFNSGRNHDGATPSNFLVRVRGEGKIAGSDQKMRLYGAAITTEASLVSSLNVKDSCR